MPILLVLILVICYCSFSKDSKSTKKNGDTNNNLVICLLLVGVVIFFVMNDMNKKDEQYKNYYQLRNDNQIPKCKNLNRKRNRDLNKLFPIVNIHSPVGSPHRLTQDLASYNYPTVDGNPDSPRHLFQFALNQSSFDCCPSTYSSDKGCICQTPDQIKRYRTAGSFKPNGSV